MLIPCLVAALIQGMSPDSLTLAESVARARLQRGAAAIAAGGVAAARAGVRVAGTISNPLLSYGYSESPPRQRISAEQSLSWLFRRGSDRAAAGALVDRARAESLQVMAELTREVRSAFYRALAGQARLRIADEQMRLADSLVRLAHRREEAGDISALEVQQAAQEAAKTRLSASVAREEARVAQAALVRATGGRGAGDLVPVGELDAGLDDPARLPAGGLRTLPVMLAAQADSAAAAGRLRSARWTQFPMPSIAAGTEWDDPTATNSNGLMTFGVSLPFPIWQHGGGAVAEARASAGVSVARMRETEMEAERELTTRWERLAERTTRARFARDSLVTGARALREGAFRLYAAGSASILEVFDGFRAERDAEVALLETLVAWQDAAADLDALMGRSE